MRILKLNLLAGLVLVTVLLAGCKSTRNTAVRTDVAGTVATRSCVENLTGRNAGADGMEARMRFSLRVGDKNLSVGGNLRMKKDRIIQLQLIGLGIIEGGRIEFTPDSVLLVDRLNRRYISSGYDGIEFLRNAQIDFYTLQAFFWNELILPGREHVTDSDAGEFDMLSLNGKTVLSTRGKSLPYYRFYTDAVGTRLERTEFEPHVRYRVDCDYASFVPFAESDFPSSNVLTLSGGKSPIVLSLSLSRMEKTSSAPEPTQVSKRYRRVDPKEVIDMLLNK